MIGSWQEESFVSIHSLISHEAVFNGDGKGVTNVKVSCHIRRRKADDIFFGVGSLIVGMKEFAE